MAASAAIKTAFSGVSAAANFGIKSLWANYKDSKKVSVPSRKHIEPIADWFGQQLTTQFSTESEEQLASELQDYLTSRDFVTLIQHIFIFLITGRPIEGDELLFSSMESGMELHGCQSADDAVALYSILAQTCSKIFELAKIDDDQIAGETQQQAQQVAATLYLQSIDSQLRRITQKPPITIGGIKRSLIHYKQAVARRCNSITPPSIDGAEPKPMDGLFVSPDLKSETDDPSSDGTSWEIPEIVDEHRVVIVGDPGGGKTTITRKISKDLALDAQPVDGVVGDLVPFIIILRDFGTFFRKESGSITDYIAHSSRKDYQVELTPEAIQFLLDTGRFYIIFDGLDELLEPQTRKDIAEIIDVFSHMNPLTKVLVTSRRIGYAHNPLDTSVFTKIALGQFNPKKVEAYVTNWFNLYPSGTLDQKESLVQRFMDESAHANDIRSNPLMLGLMCTLYRRESYIPRNRPDLYEKCSKLLFETWDKTRDLFSPLRFDAYVRPTLAFVAHAIFNSQALQSGVTERKLVELAAEYLHEKAFPEIVEAEYAAAEFVNFCKGRTWVLTEVGLSPTDDPLFLFSHRTFLEYYAALHIARTSGDIKSLYDQIRLGVIDGTLEIVGELAFQIKSRDSEGAADYVILEFIKECQSSTEESRISSISQFVTRSLAYSLISPSTVRAVALFTLKQATRGLLATSPRNSSAPGENSPDSIQDTVRDRAELMRNICGLSIYETREQVRQFLSSHLHQEIVASTDEKETEVLLAVAWKLPQYFDYDAELLEGAPVDITALHEFVREELEKRADSWPWASVGLFYGDRIPIQEVLDRFPRYGLFNCPNIPASNSRYYAPALYEVRRILAETQGRSPKPKFTAYTDVLRCSAELLRNEHPIVVDSPELLNQGENPSSLFRINDDFGTNPLLELSSSDLIDTATIVAAFCELENPERISRRASLLAERTPSPDIRTICQLLVHRANPTSEIFPSKLDHPLLRAWATGEFHFLSSEYHDAISDG